MIAVTTDIEKYFYDIHSLIKSFYPEEDVLVFVKNSRNEKSSENQISIDIEMTFEQGEISMTIFETHNAQKRGKIRCDTMTSEENGSSNSELGNELDTPKNALKKLIYDMLSKETGKVLPWGTLTGIRPVKIAVHLMDEGASDEEVEKYLKNVYYCSDEKIKLSLEIAHTERELKKNAADGNGYSLYINIPFCPTRCAYCSFMSSPIGLWKGKVDDYLECIHKEIKEISPLFANKRLDTIYVGGGTPTTLLPEQIDRLLGWVEDYFDLSSLREYTVESGRPDSITIEKLMAMKNRKVTRISVNPQTMQQRTLDLIGRHHTIEQTISSFKMAREAGFDHINMDIILGLPGENVEDVEKTMSEIEKLCPDELTVHSLAIKRASRLYDYVEKNGLAGMQATEKMMDIATKSARKMDLSPYYLYRQKNISGNFENTGYARPGKAGIYNILINEEVQSIVALGAGTVTKRVYEYDGRIERCDNVKDVKLYMSQIDEMIQRKKALFS